MSAKFTTAVTSDGFGNLKNLCNKYGLDRLVAQPDFTVRNGYMFTAFKGEKHIDFRLADITDETIDRAVSSAAKKLTGEMER